MIESQKTLYQKLSILEYPQNEFFEIQDQKLRVTKKCFSCQMVSGISDDIPKHLQKFYKKRHFLFKKFDDGILLDEESWYSVIPEVMSSYIANKLKISSPESDVVDGFCGSGGLAIQLAQLFKTVICIDIDPIKINNITKNLQVYQSIARVIQMNFLEYSHNNQGFILVMCPPWGGLNYLHKPYDLNNMKPPLQELLTKGLQMTDKIVLQLPKNIDLLQLVNIFKNVTDKLRLKLKPLEVEMMFINDLYINYVVTVPYMDEEFHLDQMQHYLDSDFAYWNPKLTTPPMLYFLNYPFIVLLSKMGFSTLIACRIINTFIYPTITFLVLSKSFQNTQKALLFSILPTIYFYNFLFYTDTLSITLLSLSFQLLQSKYYFISSIFSLCSVMSRQTNILWIVYICIKDYLDQNQAKLQFKDPRLSILFHCTALLNMILSDLKNIVRKYKYHIFILILFIGFLYTNGGVVLGDKDNHKLVFHAAQIMYFLPVLFIYFPINWNTLLQYTQLSIKRLLLSRNAKFTYLIILIICLEIVHDWTYIHPFILSDNRHYVFYVWRKILSKDVYRYCLCFIYALIFVILSRILIIRKEQTFQLILLFIFTTLSLIFSPLIEPRYFSIPLLFFYYHCQFVEQTLKKQITVFTLMNCIIVYVFCEVKFSCDFPQCRFMF